MTAQIKEINLLPKEKWEKGTLGRILKWVLNVGRYVVVFTELIVISAFLFRFGLDRKLTDLNEEVRQKTAVIDSYGDLEKKFRKLQLQIATVKKSQEESLNPDLVLTNLSQITPLDTIYTVVDIDEEEISLQGQTLSEVGLATILAKAQTNEMFSGVSLENVSSATDKIQAIDFRMVLSLDEKEEE